MGIVPKDFIRAIDPYKPGKPIEELERETGIKDAVKLASNENPIGPSRKALASLAKGAPALHRYPDGTGLLLRESLANRNRTEADGIILGNGSDEIMDLACKVFLAPGDEAVVARRTFAIYSICVRSYGGRLREVPLKIGVHDLETMARAVTPNTRIVFICNPNNPTGTIVTREDLERFLKDLPGEVLVVVDEAYGEYAVDPRFPDTVRMVRSGAPILVLRTFSKFYGLAGLRIGYGISQPGIIREMNRVRLPFNTNSLAQRAAVAALGDEAHAARTLKINREGRASLSKAFASMGLEFYPTEANFIYVNAGREAEGVFRALLSLGVIVRAVEGQWLRVSIGLARENRRFITALKRVLS